MATPTRKKRWFANLLANEKAVLYNTTASEISYDYVHTEVGGHRVEKEEQRRGSGVGSNCARPKRGRNYLIAGNPENKRQKYG